MCLIADEKIKLAVFLHFDTQFIKTLNRCITGKEVLRTRAKGDNLKAGNTDKRTGNRNKLCNQARDLVRIAKRILRNICLEMTHTKVIGTVEHAAICIAAAVNQVSITLRCRHIHARAVKVFCNQGFGRFRTKVAKEDHQRVASGVLNLCDSLQHIVFIFDRGLGLINLQFFLTASRNNRSTAALAELDREAVTADSNDTEFYFRYVFHIVTSILFIGSIPILTL